MCAMNLRGCVGWAGFFAHAEKDGHGTQACFFQFIVIINDKSKFANSLGRISFFERQDPSRAQDDRIEFIANIGIFSIKNSY